MKIIIDTSPLPSNMRYDHRGEKFGRLTIFAFDRYTKRGALWKCLCECGNIISVGFGPLNNGNTKSCGCYKREKFRKTVTVHGMHGTPEYVVWIGVHARCYNPKSKNYRYYGGRGIIMCERWKNSFINFYADMGNRPFDQHTTIDRIDGNGPYSPENCRWATDIEQHNNQRNNHQISYNGETKTIAEWARELDIPYHRLRSRIIRGMPIERAFTNKQKFFHRVRHHKASE
jgi:hypothetical protein